MNIFALSNNPAEAARWHCDKHVVKMPLETAQILSTISGGPYKPTHVNHPCTKWAAESAGNYLWLVELGFELCAEYSFRYDKLHKCQTIIESLCIRPPYVPLGGTTPFAQAMSTDCQQPDAVLAYQQYYREHKQHLASWKYRDIPPFMKLTGVV